MPSSPSSSATRVSTSHGAPAGRVDKDGVRVRDMFAQIAPRYDFLNHLLSLGIDIRWRRKALHRMRLDGDSPILDCCTGTGDLALMLARRVEGTIEVVGSDFCAPMLEIAKEKQQKRFPDYPMRFIEADSQQLPFENDAFQAVTVAFGLRNIQDTQQGIREMIRVCQPGGQVMVLEFSQPTLPGLKQVYQGYFRYVLPKIGQAFSKNSQGAYEYLPNSVLEFPSGQALADLMEACGLRDVQVFPMTFGVASLYIGEC